MRYFILTGRLKPRIVIWLPLGNCFFIMKHIKKAALPVISVITDYTAKSGVLNLRPEYANSRTQCSVNVFIYLLVVYSFIYLCKQMLACKPTPINACNAFPLTWYALKKKKKSFTSCNE